MEESLSTSRQTSDASREVRVGRILSELHERRRRGEPLDETALLAANPDIADELRLHLGTLCELGGSDDHLSGLLRKGILSASADPRYAACLGPYRVTRYIGRGGMGIVLAAYDEALRRTIALKILRPDLAEDEVARARFSREARAAAAIKHRHIVTVHAVGEDRGVHYIAMEFVEGPSLARVIRERGPLPTEMIRDLFAQLLEGLAAAHAAGLIHRDIKSANLLLTNDPHVEAHGLRSVGLKIADFGLARIAASQTKLTLPEQSFGTPEYMSPEQARGEENADQRTDLYSAGVVLYEMLTGRVPFRADSPTAVVHRILHETPTDPRAICRGADPALSSLALRLMAKRREDRFATTVEALTAFGTGERLRLPARQRRRARYGLGLVVLVAVIGIVARMVIPWKKTSENPIPRTISAVRAVENRLEVQYGSGPAWQKLHQFPDGVHVVDAALPDVDGKGYTLAVACTMQPVNGKNFFAYDLEGVERWSLNSSTKLKWPDCGGGGRWFGARVLAADLDGIPGDEIIAISHDEGEYPTRLSIIRPESGEVRSDFWHQGQFGSIDSNIRRSWIEPDYFGLGRPALIAYGLNNKLDGYENPEALDEPPWTRHDIVSVLMILDPRELLKHRETLGPPWIGRLGIESAPIYAYAFLDSSRTQLPTFTPERAVPRATPDPLDSWEFNAQPAASSESRGPWFQIQLHRGFDGLDGGSLFVDRNLDIHHILANPHSAIRKTEKEWEQCLRERWRVIIRSGEYVKRT